PSTGDLGGDIDRRGVRSRWLGSPEGRWLVSRATRPLELPPRTWPSVRPWRTGRHRRAPPVPTLGRDQAPRTAPPQPDWRSLQWSSLRPPPLATPGTFRRTPRPVRRRPPRVDARDDPGGADRG